MVVMVEVSLGMARLAISVELKATIAVLVERMLLKVAD
jgi:hypothetical protein|tara:strand:+ start:274 stop:387 length:114 start_codon:yes stop_codon:yes gene_type:complete